MIGRWGGGRLGGLWRRVQILLSLMIFESTKEITGGLTWDNFSLLEIALTSSKVVDGWLGFSMISSCSPTWLELAWLFTKFDHLAKVSPSSWGYCCRFRLLLQLITFLLLVHLLNWSRAISSSSSISPMLWFWIQNFWGCMARALW